MTMGTRTTTRKTIAARVGGSVGHIFLLSVLLLQSLTTTMPVDASSAAFTRTSNNPQHHVAAFTTTPTEGATQRKYGQRYQQQQQLHQVVQHPSRPRRRQQALRPLRDINEWRDTMFDYPGMNDLRKLGRNEDMGVIPPKEVCVLPFPFTDILLQGETKQLRLYEDRFIQLFEDCMSNYGGVVAMGMIAQAGLVMTVPICEIEAYNRMGEGFGIFVTIRVVARARILEITQSEPYIKAVCVEMTDKLPPNLEIPNLAASNIENLMVAISSMEHRLAQQTKNQDGDNDGIDDPEMERRIQVAKLEDRFYADLDDDDDDDEDEDDVEPDRRARFRQAYQVALSTDTQGYCVPVVASSSPSSGGDGGNGTSASTSSPKSKYNAELLRTPQELTALSWAAFCTDLLPPSIQDTTYRIQALDCDNLFDRLKLALYMLRAKKEAVREQMKKAGLRFRNNLDADGDNDAASGGSSGSNSGDGGRSPGSK